MPNPLITSLRAATPLAPASPLSVGCATCSGGGATSFRVAAQLGGRPGSDAESFARGLRGKLCPGKHAFLDDLRARGVQVRVFKSATVPRIFFDGTRWMEEDKALGGTAEGDSLVNIVSSGDAAEDAATLFHEGVHTRQKTGTPWREREYEAYLEEDRFRAELGLGPAWESFRDANGTTSEAGIRRFVDESYAGVTVPSAAATTAAPAAPPEEIIGRDESDQTILRRADGTEYTRAPRKGDDYFGDVVKDPPEGILIAPEQLQCPG